VPSKPRAPGGATLNASDPLEWLDGELCQLDQQSLLRSLATHAGAQHAELTIAGRTYVNFGSNDYLGLAADPRLAAAASAAIAAEGTGAGASPLVTGHSSIHRRLEQQLAAFERTEAALVFSSGYAANLGAITSLAERGDAIYSDAKNHASMIDGCRLSRADVHVFGHCDPDALARQLAATAAQYRRRLIITESLFSMDGDLAPLAELADLAERYDCMLLVDEAHASGVFGSSGRGVCEQLEVEPRVHIRIGTLSKALGSAGGFISGSQKLVDWLVNRARPYIFSTSLPPGSCAAALAALAIVESQPHARRQLLTRADLLRCELRSAGWNVGTSAGQIIPLVIGDAERAVRLAANLRESGIVVPAIRPPSVPAGESLLRISLSSSHEEAQIERLLGALAQQS
jgi:8-amino-7-oxononanoate synthase